MEILYSSHAVERMNQRNITVQEVESILTSPDGKIRQTSDKWIFYKKILGRKDNLVAAVAVELINKRWEVITVMINFEVRL